MNQPPSSLLLRRERLRDALENTLGLLHRRRADEIPVGYIDDYVALNWLEWHGGTLRITILGQDICLQLQRRLEARELAAAV